jgi:hypothetical protein
MTKNDAYKYAKRWRYRNPQGSYIELEYRMRSEKYLDEDFLMVKYWLNRFAGGYRGWSK